MNIAAIAIIVTLLIMLTVLWRLWQRSVRADYIRTYTFPPALYEKLRQRRPELALKDCQLVGRALRQFFLAYMQGGCRYVSMPSQTCIGARDRDAGNAQGDVARIAQSDRLSCAGGTDG